MQETESEGALGQTRSLAHFNLLYKRYHDARENAKGRNSSMKDLAQFYKEN